MPNHCTNIVKAPKEVLEDLFDGEKITFEKLIPMPKNLVITQGTITEDAIVYAMSKKEPEEFLKLKKMLENTKHYYYGNLWQEYKNKFSTENIKKMEKEERNYIPEPSERKLGIRTLEDFGNLCLENISKYGVVSWYDWSVENWGTKWDAYECHGVPEDGMLEFLTAWSQPTEVIKKLFNKHPNEKIEWQYEGEGNEFKGKVYSDGKGNVFNEEEEMPYEENEEEEE